MILPTFFKRRTPRRTSKRRQSLSQTKPTYDSLERRSLLATFLVTTTADVVDADDGLLSLREAVTAANSNEAFSDAPAGDVDGDRIVFAELDDSQYTLTEGQLEITDDLTVRGFGGGGGNGNLVIHGDNATRIFNVTTSERVRFQDLILEAGFTEGAGGLVQVAASGDVVFRDAQLNFGNAEIGGAISLVDSRLYVLNTQFNTNASESGGAIHATGSNLQIVESFFRANASTSDGGAIHATSGRLGLVNSDFGEVGLPSGNTAGGSGGAVHFVGTADDEARLVSNSSNFANSVSSRGGAIFAGENTSVHVLSSNFRSNGAAVDDDSSSAGGAIYSEGNGLYLTDATFNENRSFQGAGVFSAAESSNFIRGDFTDNQAGSSGGGILFHGGEAFVTETSFSGNEVEDSGGGIAIDGGAKVVLRRASISENSADQGAGVSAAADSVVRVFGSTLSDNEALVFGGGIMATDTDLVIATSTFDSNVVTDGTSLQDEPSAGGGVAAFGGSTLVFDSTFSRNETNLSGGALLVSDGFARLQDTDLSSNDSNFGGAINVDAATLVIVGGELANNSAERSGAIHTNSDSRVFVRGGTRFESNVASSFAGAIQVSGLLNLQDAEFVSNSAEGGGAIYLTPTGTAFIRNSSFVSNVAQSSGSAISARGDIFASPFLSVTSSTVSDNEIIANPAGGSIDLVGPVFHRLDPELDFNLIDIVDLINPIV